MTVNAEEMTAPFFAMRLTASSAFLLALLVFSASSLFAFFFYTLADGLHSAGFSGLTVPDAVSLEKSVHLAWSEGWQKLPNLNTFLGVVLLYYPITMFGRAYALVINVVLLAMSATLFYSTLLKIDAIESPVRTWLVAVMLVATNIYLVAALAYPNKEIALIFLTSLALAAMVRGHWLVLLAVTVTSYWFRDGYALILAMVCSVILCRRFTYVSGGLLALAFLLLLFILFPISELSSLDGSLQRNVAIGADLAGDRFSALGDAFGYVVRLAGNALNLGLRPSFIDVQGGIYLLGLGYWQFGIVLLAGLIWALGGVLSTRMVRSCLALVVLTMLLGLSYGTFVQPRYMMPLFFVLTLGLSESRPGRYIAIASALVFPLAFLMLGGLPPLAHG